MKTIYVSTGTIRDAQERAGRLYMILRDCTPVIADLNMHNMQVITESTVVRYIPASNKMDGMRYCSGIRKIGKGDCTRECP